ncbi:MAG: OmpA family protein [Proteobacteria bacterium]|nr:OmpA family protein [Pseudomonadota bacterium]
MTHARNVFAGAVVVAALLDLTACTDTPPEMNPIEIVRGASRAVTGLFGDDTDPPRRTTVEPPPDEGRPYPNLGTVPRPPQMRPRSGREADLQRLVADRSEARAADQAIRQGGATAPAGPPPAPPAAEEGAAPGMIGGTVSILVASIPFADGATAVGADQTPAIGQAVSEAMTQGARLRVVGHASRGAGGDPARRQAINRQVSAARAQAVGQEAMRLGLPRERLTLEASGDSEPLAAEATPQGAAANRRVDLYIEF